MAADNARLFKGVDYEGSTGRWRARGQRSVVDNGRTVVRKFVRRWDSNHWRCVLAFTEHSCACQA